jgi:fatty acyl-CoA reductase
MTLRKLGLSQEDTDEITERCTMFIHMAATVNFNENLRKSVELNVFGLKRMIELAYKTKNLISFIHTSTTYVNAPRFKLEIKEKV